MASQISITYIVRSFLYFASLRLQLSACHRYLPGTHAINYAAFNIESGVCFSKEAICMRFSSGWMPTIVWQRAWLGVSV